MLYLLFPAQVRGGNSALYRWFSVTRRITPVHLKCLWQTWRFSVCGGGLKCGTLPRPEWALTRRYQPLFATEGTSLSKVHRHYQLQIRTKSNGPHCLWMFASRLLHKAARLHEGLTGVCCNLARSCWHHQKQQKQQKKNNTKNPPSPEKLGRGIAVMSGQPGFVSPFHRPQCLAAAAPAGKATFTHPGKAILAGKKSLQCASFSAGDSAQHQLLNLFTSCWVFFFLLL